MSMNCKTVTDIAELYYDKSLSPETCQAIKRHLAGCQKCRNYYKQCQKLRKQKTIPVLPILPDADISEIEDRLYLNLSEKLRKRRLWSIIGTSAAIGAGSVMLTIGLLLTHKKDS